MDKKAVMEQIEKNIKVCRKCRLCEAAQNPVPGEGDIDSEVIFIGEAPGAEEDKTGRPFVGRAGKLLENLLKEIGYDRKDVWIGNILKHRPPENRDPLPSEIAACQPYLTAQIEAMKPKIIVALGRYALYYFDKEAKITQDHGRLRRVGERLIYPVYHPAAALRNPSFEGALRKDFQKIPQLIKYINENGEEKVRERVAQARDDGQIDLGL